MFYNFLATRQFIVQQRSPKRKWNEKQRGYRAYRERCARDLYIINKFY